MTKGTKEAPRYYWDACVFLSAIEGTVDRLPTIEAILDDCENGNVEIYTSVLSVTEVAFSKTEKDGKALDPSIEEKIDKLWSPPSPIRVLEFYQLIAHDAKALIRQGLGRGWKLKPADAIHLATARRIPVSEFHTYDPKLPRYAGDMGYQITVPHTDKMLFPPAVNDET